MRGRSTPYRVLLVDETRSLEKHAARLFDEKELVPSGAGCTFATARAEVLRQQPDVLVVELTSPQALLAIEAVMADRPTPILVVRPAKSAVDPFPALALGALDIAEKPEPATVEFWHGMSRQLLLLAQVRVVQHVKGKRKRSAREGGPGNPPFPLVAIAASLGGPKALSQLLRMLPKAFPAAICICQHISDGFTRGLAQWLSNETALTITEPDDGATLRPGHVYIAPSGAHFRVRLERLPEVRLDQGPPLMGFKPSCNALLSSVAEAFGSRAIGVVLTGMGRDGAKGLKDIRTRGGHTIAQDEATCVVFGMPREAVELGAAQEVLPLEEIAPALIRLVASC